ncbi:hypothetical protein AYO20_02138 [Fonsecaea nubica]|uniref:Uncharacterized protein n=1 Tax=Fonsecaea nubica TaxID=856822 RepID=A0A178D8K8_9EURO|nr:hypothetical protein AYO20_02138 [Fonsecaea nubica]OAL38489.1 hypothetical protein AYO20_02138 [Fonsecaea nubica]
MVRKGCCHDTDAQIKHKAARYPGVVFEVASSQNSEEMEELARQYIIEGGGNTCRVVFLSVNHGTSKKATLSIWKPQITASTDDSLPMLSVETEVANLTFRNADGGPSPGWWMAFPVADFAPKSLIPESVLHTSIYISSNDLRTCLGEAEVERRAWNSGGGIVDPDLPLQFDVPPA